MNHKALREDFEHQADIGDRGIGPRQRPALNRRHWHDGGQRDLRDPLEYKYKSHINFETVVQIYKEVL